MIEMLTLTGTWWIDVPLLIGIVILSLAIILNR